MLPFVLVATLVALVFVGRFAGQQLGWIAKGSLDGRVLSESVSAHLSGSGVKTEVQVQCPPEVPNKKNFIVDCSAEGPGGTTPVFVELIDLDRHFRVEVARPAVFLPTAEDRTKFLTQCEKGYHPGACACAYPALLAAGHDVGRETAALTAQQAPSMEFIRAIEACGGPTD